MNQLINTTSTSDWPASLRPLRKNERKHHHKRSNNKKVHATTFKNTTKTHKKTPKCATNANVGFRGAFECSREQVSKIVCPSLGITETQINDDDEIIMDDDEMLRILEEEIQKVKQRHSIVKQAAAMAQQSNKLTI